MEGVNVTRLPIARLDLALRTQVTSCLACRYLHLSL